MAITLGRLAREIVDVRQELTTIRQDLDELLEEVKALVESAEAWRHQSTSDEALFRRAVSGRDPLEATLSRALKGLEKRKEKLRKNIELWLDISFDQPSAATLSKNLFPSGGVVILGGGVDSDIRDLLSKVEHLADEAADVNRRLEYFGGPSGEPPSKPDTETSQHSVPRDRIFVAYSRRNQKWLCRLRTHLLPLIRGGTLDLWDDTKLTPGSRWREEIESALGRASIAVLLVSADFLASGFIATRELPTILKAESERGLAVVPVFVAPCRVPDELTNFQGLNGPERTLEESNEAEADRVLVNLVDLIRQRSSV